MLELETSDSRVESGSRARGHLSNEQKLLLTAEIASILVREPQIGPALQQCTQAVAAHLDAAVARIWTKDAEGDGLELRASAGMVTDQGGPHARALQIGRIAAEAKPYVTNDVAHDPLLGELDWAKREGLTAFAGCPIVFHNRVVGVLALFARRSLGDDTMALLAATADTIAVGIAYAGAEKALREYDHDLERRVQQRTEALASANKAAEDERAELLLLERRAREEAEAANRLKDEFLAVVSHELRTPLNAILGWTQLLQGGARDVTSLDRALAVIERNARAQARLVDDVLDATRIMQGKLRLDLRNVRIASVVEGAVEAVRPHALARGIVIEATVGADAGALVADGERLQQVVWNLLSNAVKFSDKGAKVTVEAKRDGATMEVRVIDHGVGIERDALPRIFDRFFQADGAPLTRKQKGLGLGLAIVRSLVELHGGAVSAESNGLGTGATFSVRIPIPALAPATDGLDGGEGPGNPIKWSLRGLSVLIVDDEEDHRELLRMVLSDQGALVTVADSAFAALDTLVNQQPEVVLSDIGMPHMDGYSLARRIRSLDIHPAALVAITAFAREEDRRRALEAGFDLYFTKPVDPEHLVETVARLVHQSKRGAA